MSCSECQQIPLVSPTTPLPAVTILVQLYVAPPAMEDGALRPPACLTFHTGKQRIFISTVGKPVALHPLPLWECTLPD